MVMTNYFCTWICSMLTTNDRLHLQSSPTPLILAEPISLQLPSLSATIAKTKQKQKTTAHVTYALGTILCSNKGLSSLCVVLKRPLCAESDENALHYSESLCAMRQWRGPRVGGRGEQRRIAKERPPPFRPENWNAKKLYLGHNFIKR